MKSALFSNETGEDTTPSGDTEYNFSFPSFPVRSHSTPASSDTADFTFDSFSILIKHSRIPCTEYLAAKIAGSSDINPVSVLEMSSPLNSPVNQMLLPPATICRPYAVVILPK